MCHGPSNSQASIRLSLIHISWFVPRPQRWAAGGVAAALVVGSLAGEQLHRRHQQELADRQFDTAVRVTGHALDQTRAQLLRSGIQLPE